MAGNTTSKRIEWGIGAIIGAVIVGAAAWFRFGDSGPQKHQVGTQFSSMSECLRFIERDMGEALDAITDKPGNVSGKSVETGRFFHCEFRVTGTKGPQLIGKWERFR